MTPKMAFLVRPGDINLGSMFNAMRLRQREIEWDRMQLYSQMANDISGVKWGYAGMGLNRREIWNELFG